MNHKYFISKQNGFTLVEMAMVLLIVGLLLGGLVPTLSGQIEQRHVSETRKQLDEIQQALVGFTIIYGRLPCPAIAGSNGVESPSTGGNCTYFSNFGNASYNYLPAVTLGLSGTDSSGLLEDAWGHPIRYAVTSSNSSSPAYSQVFTTSNGMSSVGISNLTSSNLNPNLLVCSTASSNNSSCSVSNSTLTSNAVAVIYSTGKNGASGGTGADEAENLNPNATDNHSNVFVSHTPSSTAGNEFDDIMIWISPNVLVSRMVSAGKLP
jgi:prepilin-type N-terminal cleavage/methylation domain-containing protein